MEYHKEEFIWNEEAERLIKEDAIVVCQDAKGKRNLITVGWKTIGTLWSKPIITIAIHPNRFSHTVIEQGVKEFTINCGGTVEPHILLCGTKSGRNSDKIKETGLELEPCKEIKVPIIKGAAIAFGCKIIHKASSGSITPHTLYFGEILEAYRQTPK
jgi:flavin reductase (DIM6/NTAB) family NADH-FMN oxidoreductase RutF